MRSAEWSSVRSWLPTPRLAGRVGQQGCVEQRDEGFGDRLGPPVRSPAEHGAQDHPGLNRGFRADIRIGNRDFDLLNQLSRKCDSLCDSLRVGHARQRPLDDATKVKSEAVRGFRGSHVTGDGVPLASQLFDLGLDGFRDQNFVQTARTIVHRRFTARSSTEHSIVVPPEQVRIGP